MSVFVRPTAILFVLLLAAPALALAQSGPTIHLTTIGQPADSGDEAIARTVVQQLERALQEQGAVIQSNAMWRFYVSATAVEDMIAFTVVQIANLTDAAIEAGAEAELFYANTDPVTLPADGTFIRQQVTEDYLRDVGTVEQVTTRLVPAGNLAQAVEAIVDVFFNDHTR